MSAARSQILQRTDGQREWCAQFVRGISSEAALRLHGLAKGNEEGRIAELLRLAELPEDSAERYPHEFSGGQRQRNAIARAIILKPKVVVLDEPTSALDRSVQGQMIDLLRQLQEAHGLSYIFISHDLSVIKAMADYVQQSGTENTKPILG